MSYQKYKVDVPEGQSGPWRIERFEVSEQDAEFTRIRAMFSSGGPGRGRAVPAGIYTRLTRTKDYTGPMMTDTPAEIRDHLGFIRRASGQILIGGLGLGMVVQACLRGKKTNTVTVIEKDPDVIKLVAPHYKKRYRKRFEVIEADVFTYKPPKGRCWDWAWWDIWPTISADNLPGMHKLHRKYARRVRVQQMSWCRDLCEEMRRQARKDAEWFGRLREMRDARRGGTR